MDYMNKCCFCEFPIDRVEYLMINQNTGVSICVHCAQCVVKSWNEEKMKDKMGKIAKDEFYEHFGTDI